VGLQPPDVEGADHTVRSELHAQEAVHHLGSRDGNLVRELGYVEQALVVGGIPRGIVTGVVP
jgi:hypothetical protein